MTPTEERITPKEIESSLGISKTQLHHWEKKLGIQPTQPSYGRGFTTLYSNENVFILLLCQRLFQQFGFTLPASVNLVQRLMKDPGMETLQAVSEVTMTAPLPQKYNGIKQKTPSGASFLSADPSSSDRVAGSLLITLQDLKEKSYGPLS